MRKLKLGGTLRYGDFERVERMNMAHGHPTALKKVTTKVPNSGIRKYIFYTSMHFCSKIVIVI